ncbi:zinc-ribbon domain-containing protein [Methylobacterium sp. NEAU 140]|uniref:zinc-ribbon domain-containing protein n=1 Tax=Methylobacterium sp. NEAU 140 TaxID=3064945 RepID=UPI002736EC0A|nr:zinc-ribbon domain-containing protein [Methylobacterium sp. NEAU 140]MDP4021071.1 zinc-ribbon domain-containing protein [Methylobacterium sp. NEAU 140]
MLITCPTCASEYRIDAARVGLEGRSVRCAACRETWFITPGEALAAHAAELEVAAEPDPVADAAWTEASAAVRAAAGPEAETPAEPAPRAARRSKPAARRRAWRGPSPALAAGLVVLAALPLACLARESVVRAVPQAAGLYARIGLPVNLRGIEIRDVVAFANPAEGARPAELVVEGDLVGVGRADVPVPPLSVEIRNAAGRAVRTFAAPAPRAVLGSGETARFRAHLVDPPEAGRAVELHFAEAGPAPARQQEVARH